MKKNMIKAVDLAEVALFVALMCASAFIKIPFPLVPLTFQTVIATLCGMMLGWKKGVAATAIYAFMGLVGIPVFAAGGGFDYVLKPSFGYIIGFIFSALTAGLVVDYLKESWWKYLIAGVVGFVVDYVIGILYFILIWQVNQFENLAGAIVTYNVLYMPKDIVLCLLAGVLAWRVNPIIKKYIRRERKEITIVEETTVEEK